MSCSGKRGLDGDIARDRIGLQLPAGKAVTDRLASQHGIGRHLRYAERLKIARIHTDTDLIAFFKLLRSRAIVYHAFLSDFITKGGPANSKRAEAVNLGLGKDRA